MTLTAQRASQRSAAVTIAPATESTVNHARMQERADELEPYLRRTGVGEALRTPGNQGALLLRADGCDGHVELTLLTFWASWDALGCCGQMLSPTVSIRVRRR